MYSTAKSSRFQNVHLTFTYQRNLGCPKPSSRRSQISFSENYFRKILLINHQPQTETETTTNQIATVLRIILGKNSYSFEEAEKAK